MRLKSRHPADQPVLITSARPSVDEEFEHRKRKYALMMSIRTLAVIGAAAFYHVSFWVSLAFVTAGVVLPWCAVIIANDGPPKKRANIVRPAGNQQERGLPQADPSRTFDAGAENIRTEGTDS